MISMHMCKNIEKEIQPGRAKSMTTTCLEALHLPPALPSPLLCTQFWKTWGTIGALLAKVPRTCLQLAHSDLGLRGRIRVVNSERERDPRETAWDLGPETLCCNACTWTNFSSSNETQRNCGSGNNYVHKQLEQILDQKIQRLKNKKFQLLFLQSLKKKLGIRSKSRILLMPFCTQTWR